MTLLTPVSESIGELEDRRSRFIAHLVSMDKFEARLAELREEHRKANHFVTAFRRFDEFGRIAEGAKDDGEPAGTSGMPCLKVLTGASLIDAGVIVVRYFGGTKLGGGGLARAYSGAASRAIEAADLRPFVRQATKTVNAAFDEMGELEKRLAAAGVVIEGREFSESGVLLTISGAKDVVEKLGL
ncbi:phosphoenolpyruvate carboxykinase [Stappia sp. GBMRC 2046]|uniref:Phosphoenolpyruvate carboxykinase n=1 Tax=Stappia sediminis TaxID=2692190 RepID=A0A7X3LVM4_9HYPH|nr:YigZ family protein [Stappia sediminis]MXN65966.1 phosphoenolpyruvate carboxykinase [Stappia sediminis]